MQFVQAASRNGGTHDWQPLKDAASPIYLLLIQVQIVSPWWPGTDVAFADSNCRVKAQLLCSVTLEMHMDDSKPCHEKHCFPWSKLFCKGNFLEEKLCNGWATCQSWNLFLRALWLLLKLLHFSLFVIHQLWMKAPQNILTLQHFTAGGWSAFLESSSRLEPLTLKSEAFHVSLDSSPTLWLY